MSHNHSHNHSHYDGHDPIDHSHDHDGHDHSEDLTPALQNHIYSQIDFSAIRCLNEARAGSAAAIIQKTWTQRLDSEPELVSDCDEQLLLTVPFTGQVRLHAIIIRTSNSDSAPLTMHLHKNRDDLDFEDAATSPVQSISLAQSGEVQEIPVKRPLFSNVSSLSLFFEDNWGQGDEDTTRLTYLGFKGEWMKLNKEPVVVLYEAAANPKDHKVKSTAEMGAETGIGF